MRLRSCLRLLTTAGIASTGTVFCARASGSGSPASATPLPRRSEHDNPPFDGRLGSIIVVDSPAVRVLMTTIRDAKSDHAAFVRASKRLLTLLSEEALAQLPGVRTVEVATPCGTYAGLWRPPIESVVAVSILRAGDALLEAMRQLEPGLAVGKLLIQRDETSPQKEAKMSYIKLPHNIGADTPAVLLLDPMLATGGSAALALQTIIATGVPEERIVFVNVVASPEGLRYIHKRFPRVKVVTAAIDEGLDSRFYIVPGLGDFGDRFFGTT